MYKLKESTSGYCFFKIIADMVCSLMVQSQILLSVGIVIRLESKGYVI